MCSTYLLAVGTYAAKISKVSGCKDATFFPIDSMGNVRVTQPTPSRT